MDFDPQSNLTTCFGAEDVDVSVSDLLMSVVEDEELPGREEYVWERNGVDFISSSIGLSAVEAKLRLEMGSEKMLALILEPLRDDDDFILIDTSPSLGTLNINVMAAADAAVLYRDLFSSEKAAVMELMELLKANGRPKQAADMFESAAYVDMLESKLDQMANEQLANSFRVFAGKEQVNYSKKEYTQSNVAVIRKP